jgi:hypothetical protein
VVGFRISGPVFRVVCSLFGDDARVLLVVMMIRSHVLLLICEAVVCRLMIVSQNISFCQAWQQLRSAIVTLPGASDSDRARLLLTTTTTGRYRVAVPDEAGRER